jgi:thiol:disulfide interchange protein DsbD
MNPPSPPGLRGWRFACAVAALALAGAASLAAAAPVRTEHVEAELVSERDALVPGTTATVALRLRIADHWHTYWRNPGETGLPTTLDWKLPEGYAAGAIDWPAPQLLSVGPLKNYGYEGEVLHLVPLAVPGSAQPGTTVTLKARADWLVCRDTCIPEGADLALALPVAPTAAESRDAGAIDATRAALPRPLDGWSASLRGNGPTMQLALAAPAGAPDPGSLWFFPNEEGRVEASSPQTLSRAGDGTYLLTLPVASELKPFDRLAGVVRAANGFGAGPARVTAATLDVPLTGSVVAGAKPRLDGPDAAPLGAWAAVPANGRAGAAAAGSFAADAAMSLGLAALFAFGGGLLLNLMPCVFPVLSLKALSLAAPGHADRTAMRRSGVAFAAGVVLAFVALAGVLLVLRAAGQSLGWGFQLQSPAVVTALALLFFALALNLSGVFEFGALLPGAAGWTLRNPYADAFLSGVLAVIIASPCTAPFMGAALGFAITQPPAQTLAVFAALGVGMALPFTLLSLFPEWRRVLPRPGPWMVRLKQLLAFPLYATVAWLAWVLGAQLDNDAVMRLLLTLVVLAFALWSWRAFRGGGSRAFAPVAAAALLAAGVIAWPLFGGAQQSARSVTANASARDDGWQAFTPTRVADLTAAGRPVFVDFTAAWCVTCQVNERLVLGKSSVRDAFAARNVALVRADWTRRDPAITAALTSLGRSGVPAYVLYRPGRDPLVLSEVLHPGAIEAALATLDTPARQASN